MNGTIILSLSGHFFLLTFSFTRMISNDFMGMSDRAPRQLPFPTNQSSSRCFERKKSKGDSSHRDKLSLSRDFGAFRKYLQCTLFKNVDVHTRKNQKYKKFRIWKMAQRIYPNENCSIALLQHSYLPVIHNRQQSTQTYRSPKEKSVFPVPIRVCDTSNYFPLEGHKVSN
jgi:hypothetical protein